MRKIQLFMCLALAGLACTSCKDNIPAAENLPQQAIDFTYVCTDANYRLDYYVGSVLKFYPVVPITEGTVTWNFGDGSPVETGDTVYHKFTVAGNYKVSATLGATKTKTHVLFISDIKPIITVTPNEATMEDGLVLVKKTFVALDVELPNPSRLPAVYNWTFPAGTTDEEGNEVSSFVQNYAYNAAGEWKPDKDLSQVKFSRVGSQTASLTVYLDGRKLETVKKNVQVAMNIPAPTLYYAVAGGNLMAMKIFPAAADSGIVIDPFDLGVGAGDHPFTLLFHDNQIYHFDAGKQFYYCNDVDSVMGDGKIQVVAKDGSSVEIMYSNVGHFAFYDPFYGCIDGDFLYFSDRNTGVRKMSVKARNATLYTGDCSYFFQNNYLGYYGVNIAFGAITAGFQKIYRKNPNPGEENGVWYCSKTYNGVGIFRFVDKDILEKPTTGDPSLVPASGSMVMDIASAAPKSFCYDPNTDMFYFTAYGSTGGFFAGSLSEIEAIPAADSKALTPYLKKFDNGETASAITDNGKGEGSSGEFIGVTELALEPSTGDVYFCFRSGMPSVPSGVIRYNKAEDKLQHLIPGVKAYGCCLNPEPTKLY
ncbi:MAG: PKD domain-containing protein [Paludibacteraceae bacterium]|nr:PKD domain-containing protein [Paludibacteraceae bacterium]